MNTTGKTMTAIATAAAIGTGVVLTTMQQTPAPTEPEPQAAQVEFIDDIRPIEVPIVTVATPEIAVLADGAIDVDVIDVGVIDAGAIALAAIELLDGDVPAMQSLQRELTATMKDQRMLQYDPTLTIYNPALAAWLDIYRQPLPPPIERIPLPHGIRMIAELRTPDHAAANLAFYRRQGYNACLITIDGTESPRNALQLVNLVRQAGMAAWIAWAGPERLDWSIYQDPAKISRLLRTAAPLCQGYLVAWRRTSAHLVEQDAAYMEHLVAQVRKANPGICIVGESYWGQTWENQPYVNQRGWQARDNVPRNPSGILIAGIATQGYAIEAMLRGIFARWGATPRLGLVLGEKAYYASSKDTGRNFKINLRIKQQVEKRFRRAGCIGTVTIHGDGSDKGTSLQTSDDLGKYPIVP
jgi:hypothetical protein